MKRPYIFLLLIAIYFPINIHASGITSVSASVPSKCTVAGSVSGSGSFSADGSWSNYAFNLNLSAGGKSAYKNGTSGTISTSITFTAGTITSATAKVSASWHDAYDNGKSATRTANASGRLEIDTYGPGNCGTPTVTGVVNGCARSSDLVSVIYNDAKDSGCAGVGQGQGKSVRGSAGSTSVTLKDKLGNMASGACTYSWKVDDTVDSCVAHASTTTCTNQNVSITTTASDSCSGIKSRGTNTATSNGTWKATYYDEL